MMRNRSPFLCVLLLLAMVSSSFGEDSPTARVNAYIAALNSAKKLTDVKGYMSKELWDYTYAPLLETSAEDQASLLEETAKSLKGFVVKGESIKDGKATVSMADSKGEETPLVMIKENGEWVISD